MQKHQALIRGLDQDQLMDFVSRFKQELYVEGLVQGNFTRQESIQFLQSFDQLQYRPLSAEAPVLFRVLDLPQAHHLCKIKSLHCGDANSEVTVYYQAGVKNVREHALTELMVMHMEEPCFDFLRTKETLGYQVYPSCRNTSGVLGFSVTVETQATKYSSEYVEMKIEEFLQLFGDRVRGLSAEGFQSQVTALVKLKQCEDAHLGEEVDRHWYEVVTQQYLYDRVYREIEVLKSFSQDELVSWFNTLRENNRRLSVHVVGFGAQEGDSPVDDAASSYGQVSELHFRSASSPWLQQATPINDIRAFTTALPLHPYHKILV